MCYLDCRWEVLRVGIAHIFYKLNNSMIDALYQCIMVYTVWIKTANCDLHIIDDYRMPQLKQLQTEFDLERDVYF